MTSRETQAIHPSGVLLRSATPFAYDGNSLTDDYTSFEFDIIDLLPESDYNQVRRQSVAPLRCLFRLPTDPNTDGPNPSSRSPDLQPSEQPRSISRPRIPTCFISMVGWRTRDPWPRGLPHQQQHPSTRDCWDNDGEVGDLPEWRQSTP